MMKNVAHNMKIHRITITDLIVYFTFYSIMIMCCHPCDFKFNNAEKYPLQKSSQTTLKKVSIKILSSQNLLDNELIKEHIVLSLKVSISATMKGIRQSLLGLRMVVIHDVLQQFCILKGILNTIMANGLYVLIYTFLLKL